MKTQKTLKELVENTLLADTIAEARTKVTDVDSAAKSISASILSLTEVWRWAKSQKMDRTHKALDKAMEDLERVIADFDESE